MAKSYKELVTTVVLNGKASPSLKAAFNQSEKMAEQTYKKLGNIGNVLKGATVAAGAALVAGAGYSLKAATDYSTSLAKVSTIADTNKKSIAQMSQETLKLSSKTGIAASEINEALYETISAGVDTSKAIGVTETAVKLAKGGFTDAATAVDGLTTVLNAYGLDAGKANTIANQFLITQNLGKTTAGELAESIGKLAPLMQSAGVGTDQMLSSVAALTANGIQTSEAVSGMKAAISNIIKPTAEAQKMAQKLGLQFDANALSSKGLAGFLKDVQEKTGGNLETMSNLFGSVEGLNAVLTLTSDQGMALMNDTMKEMQTNTTALEDAYNKMANTPAERMARLQTKFQNMAITIGEKLLPVAERAMGIIENTDFDAIGQKLNLIAGAAISVGAGFLAWKAVSVIGATSTALREASAFMSLFTTAADNAAIRQAVLSGSLSVYETIVGIATGKVSLMTVAQRIWNATVAANPIGAVVVAVAALTAGFIYLWNTCEGFRNFFINMWNSIKGAVEKIGKVLSGGPTRTAGTDNALPKFATGGTITRPTVGLIGEAGTETIVPHNNSPRSRALLAEAAAGVGGMGGGNVSITFAPTIQSGGGDVKSQLSDAADDFERRMDNYFRRKRRVDYG